MDIRSLNGAHKGEDVFVLATGSSLADFDYGQLEGRLTIGLNDFPIRSGGFQPTYHIFSDASLWARYKSHHYEGVKAICCQQNPAERLAKFWGERNQLKDKPKLLSFRNRGSAAGCDFSNNELHCGRTVANSGILLSWRMGCSRVFLLGVDCYRPAIPPGEDPQEFPYYLDGSPHLRGQMHKDAFTHEDGTVVLAESRHTGMISSLSKGNAEVYSGLFPGPWPERGIYNLSPYSLVRCFQKIGLKEALETPCGSKS